MSRGHLSCASEGALACSRLSFGVLGPLEVQAGSAAVPIPAGKSRAVLASLLMEANRVVPLDLLVDNVWGEALPANPRGALAVHILRLRRALGGEHGTDPIRTLPGGYALAVEPEQLDVLRFAALRDAAARADDADLERALLGEALALWRGRPFSDLPSDEFGRTVVPQWEEDRLRLLERRIELDLEQGRHQELVGELMQLVADNPLRERFSYLLMLALWRCHRQPESLDTFRRLRRTLIEELGVDPAAGVRKLPEKKSAGVSIPDTRRSTQG